jgi:FAD:protein FMN transferase
LFLLPLCSAAGEAFRLESSAQAMGSTFTVIVYGEDQNRLLAAAEQSLDEARRLDAMLSNYRPESEWSRVNREAGGKPVPVTEELHGLLRACLQYSRRSEGTFDITVGPLMKVWGFYKGTGRWPRQAEIRMALARVGYRHVQLEPEGRTVHFTRPGIELDPGGIGKGYAVDKMLEVLKKAGIKSAMISAAGSSIYALGAPPGEDGWRVDIKDPKNPEKIAVEVVLRNESLSTSGSYEKFFRVRGKTYSHIMDPRTGYPASGTLSVSVIAPRALDSEAWTKPLFIQGRAWAARNKPAGLRAYMCEDRLEAPCAWLP